MCVLCCDAPKPVILKIRIVQIRQNVSVIKLARLLLERHRRDKNHPMYNSDLQEHNIMKKTILAAAVFATFVTGVAKAEGSDHDVSFNAAVTSDYRYRGVSQARLDPALQVGADYAHAPTGLYVGTWATNIKWIKDSGGHGSDLEWDVYAGKTGELGGGFSYDVGGLYYYYPGNSMAANANTFELYAKVSYGPVYFKYSHALTNLFGTVDSKNSPYYDIGADFDIGYGVTLSAHVGYQDVKNNPNSSYTDWKLGVSKEFEQLAGVKLALDYVDTDFNKEYAPKSPDGKNLAKSGVVFTVSKSF
jgi:uncharacterized protein (TIGR02001 family)